MDTHLNRLQHHNNAAARCHKWTLLRQINACNEQNFISIIYFISSQTLCAPSARLNLSGSMLAPDSKQLPEGLRVSMTQFEATDLDWIGLLRQWAISNESYVAEMRKRKSILRIKPQSDRGRWSVRQLCGIRSLIMFVFSTLTDHNSPIVLIGSSDILHLSWLQLHQQDCAILNSYLARVKYLIEMRSNENKWL